MTKFLEALLYGNSAENFHGNQINVSGNSKTDDQNTFFLNMFTLKDVTKSILYIDGQT